MNTKYVYLTTPNGADAGRDLHTVGFYDPDGKWHPESDHTHKEEAAKRVNFLNGERPRELHHIGHRFSR